MVWMVCAVASLPSRLPRPLEDAHESSPSRRSRRATALPRELVTLACDGNKLAGGGGDGDADDAGLGALAFDKARTHG